MCHNAWVWTDPFAGVVSAGTTSNVVDHRDAQAATFSWYTTSGTTSTHTYQVSNSSVERPADVPAASFVDYIAFGTGAPAGFALDPGFRWGRVLREASGATVVVDFNKMI